MTIGLAAFVLITATHAVMWAAAVIALLFEALARLMA